MSENKEEKNELFDSVINEIGKRTTSPVYGAFLISWGVFHWKFLYVLLFTSEKTILSLFGVLKVTYLSKLLFDSCSFYSYVSWMLPFVFTWLIIWKFPDWFLVSAFGKEEEYRIQKKIIRIRKEKKITEEEIELTKEQINLEGERIQKIGKEKEVANLDPKIKFEEEYLELRQTKNFKEDFHIIKDLIVKHNGFLSSLDTILPSNRAQDVIMDYIFFLKSRNILQISNNGTGILLTEKGEYVVGRYIEDLQNYGPYKFGFKTNLNLQ